MNQPTPTATTTPSRPATPGAASTTPRRTCATGWCPGVDVLDVGCGPGSITIEMKRLVAPGRVVGVEYAEEALQLARAAAEEQGVDVEFVRGDATAWRSPTPASTSCTPTR